VLQLQYQFQYVFDEYTPQKAVYDYVAQPLIEDLIKGKNGMLVNTVLFFISPAFVLTHLPEARER
jgi:hypothetical protein